MDISSPGRLVSVVMAACSLAGCASYGSNVARAGSRERSQVVGPVYSAQGELDLGAGDELGTMVHARSQLARRGIETGREMALQDAPNAADGK